MKDRLRIAAFVVLLAGLAAGAGLYLGADEEEGVSPVDAMTMSKPYTRQLQQFGGKASVLFDDFARWFASLWQGKRLGITVAVLALATSGGLFLGSRRD